MPEKHRNLLKQILFMFFFTPNKIYLSFLTGHLWVSSPTSNPSRCWAQLSTEAKAIFEPGFGNRLEDVIAFWESLFFRCFLLLVSGSIYLGFLSGLPNSGRSSSHKLDPYHSHTSTNSYGSGMGLVWEWGYHDWVPWDMPVEWYWLLHGRILIIACETIPKNRWLARCWSLRNIPMDGETSIYTHLSSGKSFILCCKNAGWNSK